MPSSRILCIPGLRTCWRAWAATLTATTARAMAIATPATRSDLTTRPGPAGQATFKALRQGSLGRTELWGCIGRGGTLSSLYRHLLVRTTGPGRSIVMSTGTLQGGCIYRRGRRIEDYDRYHCGSPPSDRTDSPGAPLARPDTRRSHARQKHEAAGHPHQRGTAQPARPSGALGHDCLDSRPQPAR